MNRVFLIGNLTRDPEMRTTGSGNSVCSFAIAVNRRFKNAQTGQPETDFINIVAWRQLADLCGRYLLKGRKVAVTGSIQTRTYEAQDGSKRNAFEVVADEVEFLSAKGNAEQGGSKSSAHPYIELAVGVDVGGTDATCATLTGITRGWKSVVHIDGLYDKQGISEKMTEAAYARRIADWLGKWAAIYPQISRVYVDSAAKLFRTALREELMRCGLSRISVVGTDKSDGINARIELTCMLLMQGRYFVAEHMERWHEALTMATWSAEAYEKGEWVRVDDGSYPVDCLDSAEYSFYPYARYLNPAAS